MNTPGQPKPGASTSDDPSPYALNAALLSPTTKFQDMFAHYLADHPDVIGGGPLAVAFAAAYVLEAGGLTVTDPRADVKRPAV